MKQNDQPTTSPAANARVYTRLAYIMLPACSALALAFVVPLLNPLKAPRLDLTGWVGGAAYGLAESGSELGAPYVALAMIIVVVSRAGLSPGRRCAEAAAMAAILTVLLGGASYLSEHQLKSWLRVPRPNIRELASGEAGDSPLGMTPEEFYALPNKAERSEHLRRLAAAGRLDAARLHPWVADHWIEETGHSFPSVHSLAVMTLATFFMAVGLTCLRRWRLAIVALLVPWAVLVCLSRTVLRVHSPTDVCVGAIAGCLLGALAFAVARRLGVPQRPSNRSQAQAHAVA